jgi:hypothetical protein
MVGGYRLREKRIKVDVNITENRTLLDEAVREQDVNPLERRCRAYYSIYVIALRSLNQSGVADRACMKGLSTATTPTLSASTYPNHHPLLIQSPQSAPDTSIELA